MLILVVLLKFCHQLFVNDVLVQFLLFQGVLREPDSH